MQSHLKKISRNPNTNISAQANTSDLYRNVCILSEEITYVNKMANHPGKWFIKTLHTVFSFILELETIINYMWRMFIRWISGVVLLIRYLISNTDEKVCDEPARKRGMCGDSK